MGGFAILLLLFGGLAFATFSDSDESEDDTGPENPEPEDPSYPTQMVTADGVIITQLQEIDGYTFPDTAVPAAPNEEVALQSDFLDQYHDRDFGIVGTASGAVDGAEISGSPIDDVLIGGSGSDTLLGGDGDDILHHTNRAYDFTGISTYTLNGNEGSADVLDGGAGNDYIELSNGDTAIGGSGEDIFRVINVGSIGSDAPHIEDFEQGVDRIDADVYDPNYAPGEETTPVIGNFTLSLEYDISNDVTSVVTDGNVVLTLGGDQTQSSLLVTRSASPPEERFVTVGSTPDQPVVVTDPDSDDWDIRLHYSVGWYS